jgi:ferric-dicitrate binding protein FerR (iron transport regulator)
MDYAKFVALLKRQSQDQKLSEQEQQTLTEWKQSDPEVTDQLERIWQWSSGYETPYRPDTGKGLQQLRQRMAAERPSAQAAGASAYVIYAGWPRQRSLLDVYLAYLFCYNLNCRFMKQLWEK